MRLVCVLSIIVLLSCSKRNKALEDYVWIVTNEKTIVGVAIENIEESTSFIKLSRDNSYTAKMFAEFSNGTWEQKDENVILKNGDKTFLVLANVMSDKGKLTATINRGNAVVPVTFNRQPVSEFEANDAFSVANNQWQVQPVTNETDEQLTARIKNNIACMVAYIANAQQRKINVISTEVIATPFKYYSTGIGLLNEEELPRSWKKIFYEKADMLRGYALLKKAMNESYTIPETEDRLELYKELMKQTISNLH